MKKIISLLLVLAMLLFVFASCGGNKDDENIPASDSSSSNQDSNDDQGDDTTLTKAEVFDALMKDLQASVTKLASSSKFTITLNNTVDVPYGEDETMKVETVATIVKDGNNFRIYGDLGDIAGDSNGAYDFSFDFTYLNETLYIVLPIADYYLYFENVQAEDFETAINIVIEKLQEVAGEPDEQTEQIIANAVEVLTNGVLANALEKLSFSECENFEAVLKKAMTVLFPVAAQVQYGEKWQDVFAENNDGMTLDEFIEFIVDGLLGEEGIPAPVLAVLNSNEVMNFIKSDLTKYVDATITTDNGVKAYTLTVKKELFTDIVTLANKFAKLFDEDMTIAANVDDIVLTVKIDNDGNLKDVSFKLNVNVSVYDEPVAMGNVDFKVSVSQNATVAAPSDLSDFENIDKEDLLEWIGDTLDEIFSEKPEEPGPSGPSQQRGELDDLFFVLDDIDVLLEKETVEQLEKDGFDAVNFRDEQRDMAMQNHLKGFSLAGADYEYDGYNIYVDGEFFATFDGKYLTIAEKDSTNGYNYTIMLRYVVDDNSSDPSVPSYEPGENALDGIKFMYSNVEFDFLDNYEATLNQLGMTADEYVQNYIEQFEVGFGGRLLDLGEEDEYGEKLEYYFDGYNIYEDDVPVATFDGKYLVMQLPGDGVVVSGMTIFFVVVEQ